MKKCIFLLITILIFYNQAKSQCNCNTFVISVNSTCNSITARVGYTSEQLKHPSCSTFFPRVFRVRLINTSNPSISIFEDVTVTFLNPMVTYTFANLTQYTDYTVSTQIRGLCGSSWSDAVFNNYVKTGGASCQFGVTSPNPLDILNCNLLIASWKSEPCAKNYQLKMWNTASNYYYDNGKNHVGSNFKFYGPLPIGNYAFQYRYSYETCINGALVTTFSNWSAIQTATIVGNYQPIIYTQGQTLHPCINALGLSANYIPGGYWTVNPANGGTFNNIYSQNAIFTISPGVSSVTLTWNGPCPNNKASIVINNGFVCGTNFTDSRDNKVYPTVLIGNQCWFKKNLNYTNTTNSNGFENFNLSSTVLGTAKVYKYCYNNNVNNCNNYGALYSGTTARMTNVCPTCWRVPTGDGNPINGTSNSNSDFHILMRNFSSPSIAALALEDENNFNSHMKFNGTPNPGYIYLGLNNIQYYPPTLNCGTSPRCFVANNLLSKNITYYWSQTPASSQSNPPFNTYANWGAQFHGVNAGVLYRTIYLFMAGIEEEARYIRCVK